MTKILAQCRNTMTILVKHVRRLEVTSMPRSYRLTDVIWVFPDSTAFISSWTTLTENQRSRKTRSFSASYAHGSPSKNQRAILGRTCTTMRGNVHKDGSRLQGCHRKKETSDDHDERTLEMETMAMRALT